MGESESEVTQLCPTVCNPMDRSLPGSSIHGILQARILEWVVISFSRESPQPRECEFIYTVPLSSPSYAFHRRFLTGSLR